MKLTSLVAFCTLSLIATACSGTSDENVDSAAQALSTDVKFFTPKMNTADMGATGSLDQSSGDDDFAGHRNYQLGDSPRRVDWKASSREQGLLTKLFQGEGQSTLWLDWDQTPGVDGEQRIRQLTRWVMDAQASHKSYGLRLPAMTINPANSDAHYHRCLEALALMELP